MSQFHRLGNSGGPTFAPDFASLNLSGLDTDFSAALDPDLLDAPDWYHQHHHHQGHHTHQTSQSPHEASLVPGYEVAFSSSLSPGIPATHGDVVGAHYPTLLNHMEAVAMQPHLDNLISPGLQQTTFPPYSLAYTESTASSAQSASEDPLVDQQAEEEKRKRNQAASARFRQKKKQREQQIVEESRRMMVRTKKLEAEVDTLTRENKFLKRLLVEKVEVMSDEEKDLLRKTTGLGQKK
ncbi:hypothetical protein GQ43DRAFT_436673 [Delitschia confertaspora ATCC 74209]|uniref:BZIP domain-containing protein n=1 Tax=Delitschia confertaspora ATCC 74209 TaxID=1513339 RepID=A0A9P4JU20_9PLEO|nr:hypothetical protein GQ43DRAFT_436673 [Delitschia confertaspora ATCC 74209]